MYSEKIEGLIDAIIADGIIEDSEMDVLKRAAIKEGEDPDELEIVVKGRLAKIKKAAPEPANSPVSKFGNVMKCPSCGAQIVGGKAQCPECGYSFSNIKSNSSVEKLAKGIQELVELESRNKIGLVSGMVGLLGLSQVMGRKDPKVSFVENFPVPNTREDLLEFLTSIQPKAKKPNLFTKNNAQLSMEHAYWSLYANCINKARISFANDPDFEFFFKDYKKR